MAERLSLYSDQLWRYPMYFSRSRSALPILIPAVTTALCAQVKVTSSGPVASVGGQQASNAPPTVKEPETPSEFQTLSGQLVYHDGIRKWFELKLDRAQSGQSSIQLLSTGQDRIGNRSRSSEAAEFVQEI
jgi:hypothetical protein